MYISIDLGGTNCRIAAVSNLNNIKELTKKEFKLKHHFEDDLNQIKTLISEISSGTVSGIGLGVPGSLNAEKTELVGKAKNLSEWRNKPIKKLLEEAFHCPVFMDNDAVTASLGEAYFGKETKADFVYITWGTGIGGATVRWENKKAKAQKLDWYEYLQSWEEACGGNAIHKRFNKPAETLSENEWTIVMQDFVTELHKFSQKIKMDHFIFGGGIAMKQRKRLESIPHPANTTIHISSLGEDNGLYGALSLLDS